jgi:tetratricopeptide (TPR) repeat protein
MEAARQKVKDKNTKVPYPPSVKKFEQACLLYLQAFPKGEKAPEIRKRLGALYYVHNDYEPALNIFRGIIKDSPNSKDVTVAAEYILDIYNQRNDIEGYQKEAVDLLNNPTIAKSPVGKEIRDKLNTVSFLKADTLSKGGKFTEAASSFELFAKTHASSPQAFTASYNAAINYEKGGDLPNAQRMYEQMLADPSNAKDHVSLKQDARAALAEIYRKTGQLEHAAVAYEESAKFLSGAKSTAATNNAAILWLALGRTEKANAAMNRLDKETKKEAEKTDRLYDRAEMYYAKKDYGKATYYYEKFQDSPGAWRNASKCMRALYLIGDMAADKGSMKKAEDWFKKVVAFGRDRGLKAGPKYASQAKFWFTRKALDEMRAVRLGTSEKSITTGLQNMKYIQTRMVKDLKEVIRYDYGPMIVAALSAEAESYEIVGRAFANSPIPREYKKPEEQKQFKDLAGKEAAGLLTAAKDKYKGAFDRGLALEAYGQPLLDAARGHHRLDPADTKNGGEMTNVGNILDRVGL